MRHGTSMLNWWLVGTVWCWCFILPDPVLQRCTSWAFTFPRLPSRVHHPLAASTKNDRSNLEQLKESIDIVDVVESYNLPQFTRHGGGATALCPFHDDTHPSLSVSREKQLYKCFACNVGGDVLHFVDQYSKLPGQQAFSNFGELLQHVNTKFGDGKSIFYNNNNKGSQGKYSAISRAEREDRRQQKKRILLANAAAATYFCENLVQPFAGAARFHLMDRRIDSSTISQYALGFAPDCYYGNVRSWGDGSLVEFLQRQNFTATEIVDAGLAIVTKSGSNLQNNETKVEYSDLMDRFRNRLIVPIFDESGTDIVGFGGRELPVPGGSKASSNKTYKIQKYLNSPETLVFAKKKNLFGLQQVIASRSDDRCSDLLVVEGYMDAISLANAGIKNTVATMGTAVSPEQLNMAARSAEKMQCRVVLCFDNDQAGMSAVERLCTNGMLRDATKQHAVCFAVAHLPIDVKDPAEFMELRASDKAAGQFQTEVVGGAVDWTDWYIQQIMGQYVSGTARGATGSFSRVFERIAEFLASSMEQADRTKRAYEIAGDLANILASEQNKTVVSKAVHTQLESDLIELVSRLSNAKDAVKRRAESLGAEDVTHAAATLVRGGGPSEAESKKSLQLSTRARKKQRNLERRGTRVTSRKRRVATMKRGPTVESLTPHFGGFQFANKADRAWLGINQRNKVRSNFLCLKLANI